MSMGVERVKINVCINVTGSSNNSQKKMFSICKIWIDLQAKVCVISTFSKLSFLHTFNYIIKTTLSNTNIAKYSGSIRLIF